MDRECPAMVRALRTHTWRGHGSETPPARVSSFRTTGDSFDLKSIREYEAGDDMRRVDWNLFGRSGRLFIKEYFGEVNDGISIVVDVSASVGVFGTAQGPASRLAASIGWMCGAMGMPAEILAFSDRETARFRTSRGSDSPYDISHFFMDLVYAGRTDLTAALSSARSRSRNRRVLVISDFFDAHFDPAASPFVRNYFIRLRRDFTALILGASEADVRDPESGTLFRVPWDSIASAKVETNESSLDRLLGFGNRDVDPASDTGYLRRPAAGKAFWYRRFEPVDDRVSIYLDFFGALNA